MDLDLKSMSNEDLRDYLSKLGGKPQKNWNRTKLLSSIYLLELKKMTVSQLKKYALELDISIPSGLTKDKIINHIYSIYLDSFIEKNTNNDNNDNSDTIANSVIVEPGKTKVANNLGAGKYHLTVYTICPKCGENIYGSFLTQSNADNIFEHKDYLKLFSCCPACGKKLLLTQNNYLEKIDNSNHKSAFKELKNTITQSLADKYLTEEQKNESDIISTAKNKVAANASNILSSTDNLKTYLNHLIHIESDLYYLRERYVALQIQVFLNNQSEVRTINFLNNHCEEKIISETNTLNDEIYELKDKIARPKRYIQSKDIIIDFTSLGIEKPHEPTIEVLNKPVAPTTPSISKPIPPLQPTYKKPNLFNRKRILAENDSLKNKYEFELSKYQEEIDKYNIIMEQYRQETESYSHNLEEYNQSLDQYNKAEEVYQDELKQYDVLCAEATEKILKEEIASFVAENKSLLAKKKSDIKAISSKEQKILKDQLSVIPQIGISSFLALEIKTIKAQIRKLVQKLEEMYSANIIYGKYRNYVALTTIFEYLDSGRCNSLEGPDGAYNLYEAEIRSNEIISQLSTIVRSLEDIKANQFMLYKELKSINQNLKSINTSMDQAVGWIATANMTLQQTNRLLSSISVSAEKMSNDLSSIDATTSSMDNHLKDIKKSTEQISNYSKAIVENTALTSYYSAVNAQYSKINAELTDALGFMIAMR